MEKISEKYIKIANTVNQNCNFLRVVFYYDIGHYNLFTYENQPRGYYLSITPVSKHTKDGVTMEEFTAFSGYKTLLKECSRKSKKAQADAELLLDEAEKNIINKLCFDDGFILEV